MRKSLQDIALSTQHSALSTGLLVLLAGGALLAVVGCWPLPGAAPPPKPVPAQSPTVAAARAPEQAGTPGGSMGQLPPPPTWPPAPTWAATAGPAPVLAT